MTAGAQLSEEAPTLRVRDVARRFDVSEKTVYVWIRTKKLRSTKLGGAVRLYPSDVARMEASGTTMPAQPTRRAG